MRKIIDTADGSLTIYDDSVKESFHSRFGAISESRHIFIEAGLKYFFNKTGLNILEVGFGTGLNAFLTLQYAVENDLLIEYHAVEPFPLDGELLTSINYQKIFNSKVAKIEELHHAPWNQRTKINKNFTILKSKEKIELLALTDSEYDIIYFDAFSPEAQPELWTEPLFAMIYKSMSPLSVLVTYCCKGIVKRTLLDCGFQVEKLPGPIGKREFLRAKKTIQ